MRKNIGALRLKKKLGVEAKVAEKGEEGGKKPGFRVFGCSNQGDGGTVL
jgi:hypothetical protein